MICEAIPVMDNETLKKFEMKADKNIAVIVMNIENMTHQVRVKMLQFGVNLNKAATRHTFQSVSLNITVVRS